MIVRQKKRTESILLLLTPKEKMELKARADKMSLDVNSFVRMKLFSRQV